MMKDKSQLQGFCLFALLGPMVAVGVFGFAMNEPASANAGGLKTEFLPLPEIPTVANKSIKNEKAPIPNSSPFWFEEVEMSLPVMPNVARSAEPNAKPDPVFRLSSVLPSASKSFAVINGKARSIGDEIEPGWILVKISGQERFVIIKHTSGRRVRVLMSR